MSHSSAGPPSALPEGVAEHRPCLQASHTSATCRSPHGLCYLCIMYHGPRIMYQCIMYQYVHVSCIMVMDHVSCINISMDHVSWSWTTYHVSIYPWIMDHGHGPRIMYQYIHASWIMVMDHVSCINISMDHGSWSWTTYHVSIYPCIMDHGHGLMDHVSCISIYPWIMDHGHRPRIMYQYIHGSPTAPQRATHLEGRLHAKGLCQRLCWGCSEGGGRLHNRERKPSRGGGATRL